MMRKRVLITGVNGFVGQHLSKQLLASGDEVWGTVRADSLYLPFAVPEVHRVVMELQDEEQVADVVQRIKPDHVYHLAGQSNVRVSWDQKVETVEANLNGTLRLLEALRLTHKDVRVLTIGSAEEYGPPVAGENTLYETTPCQPRTPYGISKQATGQLARMYKEAYGMHVVHARPFNHIGPGQSLGFVTQDFAQQIVEIEAGHKEPTLATGNLEAMRDFTDVRDIVKAYEVLLHQGQAGEVYNVCSGEAISIRQLLQQMITLSKVDIQIVRNEAAFRPIDVPVIVGSRQKLTEATGWEPTIPLQTSLADLLEHRRNELRV